MLYGIDISSRDSGIVPHNVDADFVIVKATGGVSYENPHWREWADDVLASGKLLGLYHFAHEAGRHGSAAEEAAWFLSRVKGYSGRFVPVLDWEADAIQLSPSWAREWLDTVARETGATPMFYAYAGHLNSRDYSAIAGYPLWMASYLNKYVGAGYVDNPDNTWPTGSWDRMAAYQYTETGRVGGYGGKLDLSVFYGSRDDWKKMEGGSMANCAEIARQVHLRMVNDDRFGYSWEERYGATTETWEVCGRPYQMSVGDYDCSSSTITAWKKALEGTPYEGALDGATYTGNMRSVFCASGLFDWVPCSLAEPGDLYLNESTHVAMCQGSGLLSEFCWGDNGAYGNRRGDQSGGEAAVHPFYDYPWDGCLRYNGKAGSAPEEGEDEMQAIYCPDGKNYMVWYDGSSLHMLDDQDEMEAVRAFYRQCTGKEIPVFSFGTPDAPWAHRFEDAVQHGFEQEHM